MLRPALSVFVLAFAAVLTTAQLQNGDVVFASATGYRHFRAGIGTTIVPTTVNGGTAFAITNMNNGSMVHIPGTNLVLIGTGVSPFPLYVVDFATNIAAPSAYHIGNAPGASAVIGMSLDRATGDAYFIQGTSVYRIPGPITTTSAAPTGTFATGQTGQQAVCVLNNSQVVVASTAACWAVSAGATAPSTPNVVTFAVSGCSDLDFDPVNNRLIVSAFGSSRVDLYDLGSGALVSTPLVSPQISIVDAADYDEASDTVYAVSRLTSTIGGLPYGVQNLNDNVVVAVSANGPSSNAIGITPNSGNGNSGGNPYFVLVKPQGAIVNAIEFTPSTAAIAFGSGTLSANTTVSSILGLPNISSPAQDPLVGATVTLSASFTGTDTAFMSNLALSNIVMNIHQTAPPPATPDVVFNFASATTPGVVANFVGSANAAPTASRRFLLTSPSATINGGTSASLANFAARVVAGASTFSLNFSADGTPDLVNIYANAPAGLTAYETRLSGNGTGAAQYGVINATPGAELYLLVTATLATPLGSGPFLGLAADIQLFSQATAPVGAQPFHVLADPNGQYSFFTPGPIPAGTQVDYVSIQYQPFANPPSVVVSPARRVTF